MRVTFPRLPDRERGYALVERDDGVVYRLHGGPSGPRLPHDLRHHVVERELGLTDGIWAGIASGMVFTSMQHLRGRRPPHAAERSRSMMRASRDRLLRAELLADLTEAVAALEYPTETQIRRLAGRKLAVLPALETDPILLARAAAALQVEAARWARLRVGEELRYDWPRLPRPRPPRAIPPQGAGRTSRPHAPRIVRRART